MSLAAALSLAASADAGAPPPCLADTCGAAAVCPSDQVAKPVSKTPPMLPDLSGLPVEIESAGAEVTVRGEARLKGPVRVQQGPRTLTAGEATYQDSTRSVDVSEAVTYQDSQLTLAGDTGTWNPNGTGEFKNADFLLSQRASHGHAADIKLSADGKLALTDVSYTACPAGRPDWMLRAGRVDIEQATQEGTAHDMTLDVRGIPVLYLPLMSFPVGDARKSGFLFPMIGETSTSGLAIATPYYWNLAPNYDATLTPGYLSLRGATLGSEFRFLTDNSRGTVESDWIPNDIKANSDRGYFKFGERTDFSPHLRLDTNLAYVTDSHYFEDFGSGSDATSVTYLQRAARLTYLDDHWQIVGLIDQFQTINLSIAPIDRPYNRVPEVDVRGHWNDDTGFGAEVHAQAVDFVRGIGVQGLRGRFDPTVSYTWRTPGAYLIPSIGYETLAYALRNVDSGPTSLSISAPKASVDAGLEFERDHGTLLQSLEPRLLYSYVPFRDQSNAPVFDTATPDLNTIQLFKTDRYVGGDRLADENQLAIGATSRLVDLASGRQWLSATLGQIYYFTPPRVTLPTPTVAGLPTPAPTTSVTPPNSSDIVGQLDLSAYQNWNVAMGEVWNPHDHRADLTEILVRYQPAPGKIANIGYRFRRDLLEQVEGSFAWPVAGRWNLYAREVYSLQDHATTDAFAGFEYQACCFRLRFLTRHYVSTFNGDHNTSFTLQVELNGLSSVSGRSDAFLQQAIRGYSSANPNSGIP